MTWCWLDLAREPDPGATACAAATTPDGAPASWLLAWLRRGRPSATARRIDHRVVDPAGAGAWVSLVRPPAGVRLPFDDLAVQQARRAVLAGEPMDAVTTLLNDASHFEGALTVARGEQVARLSDDPFARVFPQQILCIEAGVLGTVPPPCGPTIERYGSANPWPWDRFSAP
jgi:fermentation-respiration switch protein FrsA (DUF1100 family)